MRFYLYANFFEFYRFTLSALNKLALFFTFKERNEVAVYQYISDYFSTNLSRPMHNLMLYLVFANLVKNSFKRKFL